MTLAETATLSVSHSLSEFVLDAGGVVRRWGVRLDVPPSANAEQAASMIRSAFINAADKAAAWTPPSMYPDDNSWSNLGMRGLTAARISEEMVLAADPMAAAPDDWGIMARAESGDFRIDVPLILDLDADSARNIMTLIDDRIGEFVDLNAMLEAFGSSDFDIRLVTGNWGDLREQTLVSDIPMDRAIYLRRPGAWDILRARLADLPCGLLTPFLFEEFHSRYAKSTRYDRGLMASSRSGASSIARMSHRSGSAAWLQWFPAVSDVLLSIGKPVPMDGMSVILNFVVEEPSRDDPSEWIPVSVHNMVVAYGLHPLTVFHVFDFVQNEPDAFYDMPETDDRRFRLLGASVIQDALLSTFRASTVGRTQAYDRLAALPPPGPPSD